MVDTITKLLIDVVADAIIEWVKTLVTMLRFRAESYAIAGFKAYEIASCKHSVKEEK